MTGWTVTTAFAAAAVRDGTYPRLRRFPDAVVRGALLLDLAAARLVSAHGDGLHPTAGQCGFPPADRLLEVIVNGAVADVRQLVWRGPVGMADVIGEFLERGWWEREPGLRWRLRRRYRPTRLVASDAGDPQVEELVHLMMLLFQRSTDTDDVETAAGTGNFGWPAHAVFHELIELRAWLAAATTMSAGA